MDKALEIKKAPRGNQVTLMSWSVDYVPAEQNLETIGYFSARYARRALDEKQKSKVIVLSDSRRIEIVPSMKYGFPNAEDLDFYLIVDEDHWEYRQELPQWEHLK